MNHSNVPYLFQSRLPLCLLSMLQSAIQHGRLVVTLPWLLDCVAQMDLMAAHLTEHSRLFSCLLHLQRHLIRQFSHHTTHAHFMMLLLLGAFTEVGSRYIC